MTNKRTEDALRDSEQQIRTFLDSTTDMAFLKDENFRHIIANRALCKFYGKTQSEIIGKTDFDLMDEQAAAECRKTDEQTLISNALVIAEEVVGGRYYETRKFPVALGEGQKGIGAYIREITDRKQAEEKVRLAHDRLRRFIDSNIVGVVIATADGTIVETNDYYLNMIGFTREEFEQGRVDWRKITPPEWLPADENAIREMHEKGTCTPYEKEYQRRDGSRVSVFLTDALLPGPEEQIAAFALDVTEWKRAEQALRKSESELKETQKMAHLGSWHWDVKTGNVEWSEEVYKIFYLDPQEFTPHIDSILALSPWPEDHQRDKELIKRSMETHTPGFYEQKFLRPDKSIGYYYSTFQGNYDLQGELVSIVGTVMDITEQKRVEEEIVRAAREWQMTFDSANDAIWLLDKEQRVLRSNKISERFFQRPCGELVGIHCWEIVHGTSAPIPECPILQAKQSLRRETRELQIGNSWFSVTVDPIIDVTGQYDGAVHIVCDITERKRSEEALREKEVQYRNLADTGLALVWASGTDKLCTYFNAQWLKYTGRTVEQEMGNGWTQGVHPEDLDRCVQIYVTAFDKREAFDMDYRLHHISGQYRWIRDLGTPNYNSSGQFIGYIGHCFDITAQREAEEEVRKLNENLEQKISERTAELQESITHMEELNRVFVDRELRMMELKERIAELEKKT